MFLEVRAMRQSAPMKHCCPPQARKDIYLKFEKLVVSWYVLVGVEAYCDRSVILVNYV